MKRSKKGQSMVEYAVGLGCVTALCMVALGSLGHISGDIIHSVQSTINYGGTRPSSPGRMVSNTATPWVIN
jgi:hypothetical protein